MRISTASRLLALWRGRVARRPRWRGVSLSRRRLVEAHRVDTPRFGPLLLRRRGVLA